MVKDFSRFDGGAIILEANDLIDIKALVNAIIMEFKDQSLFWSFFMEDLDFKLRRE